MVQAVARAARLLIGLVEREELVAHEWVHAPQRHRATADGEVVRGKIAGLGKMSGRGLASARSLQRDGYPPMNAGQLFVLAREELMPANGGFVKRQLAGRDPTPQRVVMRRRIDTVKVLEHVAAEGDVIGAYQPIVLVDPNDRRNIADVIGLGNHVVTIEQDRKADVLDPFADVVRVLLDSHADDREAMRFELNVYVLPDRQVVAAPSPRGKGNEQLLPPPEVGQFD